MEKSEDLDKFLEKVGEISELVMGLNCADGEVQRKAMEKADCYIAALDEPCRTKVNKTRINTNPPTQASVTLQHDSPENFLKIIEKDAEARRIRRLEKEEKATALKDKGNEAYAQEDYGSAVRYYTEGLAELRDMQPLYTNRAQAFIKLGKYQDAISDCEWAVKCNKGCIKAYLHMGKAYLALKKYSESRSCFEKIVELEPGKEKMMKEYLIKVDLEEERESQELSAMQEFDKGDMEARSIPVLLEKLSVPEKTPFYYCGGFMILSQAVTDCIGQTLFRLNNGFTIISSNDTVRRCLLQKPKDSEIQELCVSVLKLWRTICRGNAENQKMLMECPVGRQSIVHLSTSEDAAIQKECLELLGLYSQTPYGVRLVIDNLNVHTLTRNIMVCIRMQQQEDIAVTILDNFTTENKFCIQLRDELTDSVIVPFTTVLRNINKSNQHVLPSLISAVHRLARDDVIHHNFVHDPECWKAFLDAIRHCNACEYKDVLYPMLGLIINLSTIPSPVIQDYAVSLSDCCMDLLRENNGGIVTRAVGMLSMVLPQSSEAVQHVIKGNAVRILSQLLKRGGQTTKYAMKALTVCTAASHVGREELLKSDKKLSVLRHLLDSSCDEMVSGNAALCFAHCLELKGTASNLLGTDIVPLLLHAAVDAKSTAVQKNMAIALGKLCQSEPRHMHKLREMHGLEILHSCMKLIT